MRPSYIIWILAGAAAAAGAHATLARPRLAPVAVFDAEPPRMRQAPPQPALSAIEGRSRLRARLAAFVEADGRASFGPAVAELPAQEEGENGSPRARPGGTGRDIPGLTGSAREPYRPLTDPERRCLAEAVYYEARSESDDGQAAVAEVILNRAASGRYPTDVCEVVYQRNARACQFTYTCDGSIGRAPVERAAWVRAEQVATAVAEGRRPRILPERSVNYHADYVAPGWGRRLERVQQIGAHIFYGALRSVRDETPGVSGSADGPAGLEFRLPERAPGARMEGPRVAQAS